MAQSRDSGLSALEKVVKLDTRLMPAIHFWDPVLGLFHTKIGTLAGPELTHVPVSPDPVTLVPTMNM